MKGYIVSDGVTGYLWCYDLYCAEGMPLHDHVESLLEPTNGKGYIVYMDNLYNLVDLANKLIEKIHMLWELCKLIGGS